MGTVLHYLLYHLVPKSGDTSCATGTMQEQAVVRFARTTWSISTSMIMAALYNNGTQYRLRTFKKCMRKKSLKQVLLEPTFSQIWVPVNIFPGTRKFSFIYLKPFISGCTE